MRDKILSILTAGPMTGMTSSEVRDKLPNDPPSAKVHVAMRRMEAQGELNSHVTDENGPLGVKLTRVRYRIARGGKTAAAMKKDTPLLDVVEELRAVTREHSVKLDFNNEALRRD